MQDVGYFITLTISGLTRYYACIIHSVVVFIVYYNPILFPTFQDNKKKGYLDALPGILKQFSVFLGERKWFAGDKVKKFLLEETCWLHRMFWSYTVNDSCSNIYVGCAINYAFFWCRSHLWTSSCMNCWTSTACLSPNAWTTSRTSKISWTDLRFGLNPVCFLNHIGDFSYCDVCIKKHKY